MAPFSVSKLHDCHTNPSFFPIGLHVDVHAKASDLDLTIIESYLPTIRSVRSGQHTTAPKQRAHTFP